MKNIKITKKYVVLLVLSFVMITFVYSHLTSYFLSKEVDKIVENNPLMNMDIYAASDYLKKEGYNVELIEDDNLDVHDEKIITVYANKNKESIEIESNTNTSVIKYEFKGSNSKITPLIKELQWQDNLRTVRRKLGVNVLNTGYTWDKLGVLKTYIHLSEDGVLLIKPKYGKCWYDIFVNEKDNFYWLSIGITDKK